MLRRTAPLLLLAGLAAVPAAAQDTLPRRPAADRVIPRAVFRPLSVELQQPRLLAPEGAANPCAFGYINVRRYGMQPFRNPPEVRASGGVLRTPLNVQYSNPATTSIAGCPVTLRTYNGQLVGPTLRVRPGEVLAPPLVNRLPVESAAEVRRQFMQEDTVAFINQVPASFNTTNLHTHGLHVSPRGNGDNVLLAIAPQTTQPYNIPLPRNHTRGTYWYHAHTHGSTAIQVGSGMAGALIVDDDPAQLPPALRAASDAAHEKVWVIGTILYDTNGKVDNIAAFFPDQSSNNPDSLSHSDSVCVVQQNNQLCAWNGSKRRVTVNGQIVPVIRMRPGEVQRWRLIDGAFRASVFFQVQEHALNEIATDGIYTGRVDTWADSQSVQLQPGYRSDVLIQAHRRAGSTAAEDTFQIIDAPSPAALSVRGVREPQNLIALLIVGGAPVSMALPTSAEMARLNPFPGVDLSKQANQVQQVDFKLGSGLQPTETRNYFQVNYAPFTDGHRRYVKLNDIDMWNITTVGDPPEVPGGGIGPAPHVFHIHVNPFQVQRQGPGNQTQVVWKDTELIPAGDTINIYTHYTEFLGAFVMHCHILDHEDLGMMEVVEVVDRLPRGHTGVQAGMMHGMPGPGATANAPSTATPAAAGATGGASQSPAAAAAAGGGAPAGGGEPHGGGH